MKTISYRLTLDVEFDPNGTLPEDLKHNLNQVIRDAVNNGTLTGETPATVEKYSYTVDELKPANLDIDPITRFRLGAAFRDAIK